MSKKQHKETQMQAIETYERSRQGLSEKEKAKVRLEAAKKDQRLAYLQVASTLAESALERALDAIAHRDGCIAELQRVNKKLNRQLRQATATAVEG